MVGRITGQKQLRHAVMIGFGQFEAECVRFDAEEFMGQLDQDARAVTGLRVRAHGAAMLQIAENLQPVLDDLTATLIANRADHADAAGVMLAGRVVEALGRTLAVIKHGFRGS